MSRHAWPWPLVVEGNAQQRAPGIGWRAEAFRWPAPSLARPCWPWRYAAPLNRRLAGARLSASRRWHMACMCGELSRTRRNSCFRAGHRRAGSAGTTW